MTAPRISWHSSADATIHRATYPTGMPAAIVRQTHPDAWAWWAWNERGRRIGLGGGYAKVGEAMACAEHVVANSGGAAPVAASDDVALAEREACLGDIEGEIGAHGSGSREGIALHAAATRIMRRARDGAQR